MGHEVGHVLARHFAQRLVKTYTLQGLIAIALGQDPNKLAELGAERPGAGLPAVALARRRDRGRRLRRAPGQPGRYDPNGLATFFQKLEELQGQTPSILKYLMGHPPPGDREKHIREYITTQKLAIGATNETRSSRCASKLPAGLPTATHPRRRRRRPLTPAHSGRVRAPSRAPSPAPRSGHPPSPLPLPARTRGEGEPPPRMPPPRLLPNHKLSSAPEHLSPSAGRGRPRLRRPGEGSATRGHQRPPSATTINARSSHRGRSPTD